MDRISVDGKKFVDEYGRERIFYGINFGTKNIPFYKSIKNKNIAERYINDSISYLKSNGINLIRYMVNWSYIEPQPKHYCQDVLNEIAYVLDVCEKNAVYVILDMHQDLYSSFSGHNKKHGFGDGAPFWACLTDGYSYTSPRAVWAGGYFFSKAVWHSFDNFWNNTEVYGRGLQDHFCDLWKMLAHKFADHNALIGFDIFNEPYPGSVGGKIFRNIVKSVIRTTMTDSRIDKKQLLSSLTSKDPIPNILSHYDADVMREITATSNDILKRFDREKYMPFVNKVSSAIRDVSQRPIIFMEHTYYSNLGIPFSGTPINVNGIKEKNQAYAPHGYDFMVDTELYKYADDNRVGAIFAQRLAEQKSNLDMPVLVGEWGGGSDNFSWLSHAEYLLNTFDKSKWSHCYWVYFKQIKNSPIMDMLCRTHPVSVNGRIDSYEFSREKQVFTLRFTQKCAAEMPTVIFCHRQPRSVITDFKYNLISVSDNRYMLELYSDIGNNFIEIHY